MHIEPYLFFEGRSEEAIEFYKRVLGAKVERMLRNNQNPEPPAAGTMPPGSENKIMHASLMIGQTRLMCSDGMCSGQPRFGGISLALNAADPTEARRFFDGLSEGGQVRMPLGKTFFSPAFGMVTDRFGVAWMVIAEH